MFDINKIKEPESLNEALIELNNNPDFKIICVYGREFRRKQIYFLYIGIGY